MSSILHSLIFLAMVAQLVTPSAHAMWNVTLDGDARGKVMSSGNGNIEIHAAGLLLRKSIADPTGDRFMLTMLAEAYDSFREIMLHEASLRLKGPMGRWNITGGRFTLPYGLLSSFSTTRLLFSTWYDELFGFDVDNGILVSGIKGDVDYGIALTQGLGPHHRFSLEKQAVLSGRIGYTLGDAAEYIFGVSVVHGNFSGMRGTEILHPISGLGLDATVTNGPLTLRISIDGGTKDDSAYLRGFLFTQYGINRYVDIDLGTKRGKSKHNATSAVLYAGCTTRNRFLTIRGGYTYGLNAKEEHLFSIQLYRLFSAAI